MIPFVLSFEDFVDDEEGVPDQYTYRLQYFGKIYYVCFPMDFADMSVSERQNAVMQSFAEAFMSEQQEKLGERPSDIQEIIDDTLSEYGIGDEEEDEELEDDED